MNHFAVDIIIPLDKKMENSIIFVYRNFGINNLITFFFGGKIIFCNTVQITRQRGGKTCRNEITTRRYYQKRNKDNDND